MAQPAIRPASARELETWDEHTVDPPGGNVYQSRAWGEYQAERGWQPHFLIDGQGGHVLALMRRWPLVGGGTAYLPRGPVAGLDTPAVLADRLRAVSEHLAGRGADVISSDAEMPADSGYAELLRSRGFRPAEEIQPSRHRLFLPLGPQATEAASFAGLSMSARQRVRGATKRHLRVVLYDADPASGAGLEIDRPAEGWQSAERLAPVFDRFYDVLISTAQRRGFRMAARERVGEWSSRAVLAGLAIYLEVRSPDDEVLGGGLFYRHGRRLTYANAGDDAARRREYPGAIHLLLWRAVQMAIAEGRDELDLGGVDVRGARRRPVEGEPMHGLLAFKESFGGQWLELAGNHRRVARPIHYLFARAGTRLAWLLRRGRGLTREPAAA